MSAIIRVHGTADGTMFDRPLWVESYDVDAPPDPSRRSRITPTGVVANGAFGGRIELTAFRERAKRFADNGAAMLAWNTQSKRRPLRPDGRPNKPLTALTVEVEPAT